jgi:hypothetical protein
LAAGSISDGAPRLEKVPEFQAYWPNQVTRYPDEPTGVVVVQNHVTINVRSDDFRELSAKLDEVLSLLRRSNEISGEVRDQLAAEVSAGKALLAAPKMDPGLIDVC